MKPKTINKDSGLKEQGAFNIHYFVLFLCTEFQVWEKNRQSFSLKCTVLIQTKGAFFSG